MLELSDRTITLREPVGADLDRICDYWYRSPHSFIREMGVAPEKLPTESNFRTDFLKDIGPKPDRERQSCILTIEYKGKQIGYHKLSHIHFGQHGIFHAHIIREEYRKKGIGAFTYPRALRIYFDRFNLKKILFKTPAHNIGPNKVKQKMGIQFLRQEKTDYPLHPDGMLVNVYEISRDQMPALCPKSE